MSNIFVSSSIHEEVTEPQICIPLQEYRELLQFKGKYEILKEVYDRQNVTEKTERWENECLKKAKLL